MTDAEIAELAKRIEGLDAFYDHTEHGLSALAAHLG